MVYAIGSALCIWLASSAALPRTSTGQYVLICTFLAGSLIFQALGIVND